MHAATIDRAEFAPPQPPGQLRALGLAVLAHVLLLGALTWGVNWKHQPDNTLTVDAELWSAVPREAAPKLVETPPPPPPPAPVQVQPRPAVPDQRDADIALARQKKEAEKKAAEKLEAEKKRLAQEKLEREQKKAAEEKKKLAQEALRRDAQKLEAKKKEDETKAATELKAQRDQQLRRIAGLAGATGGENAAGSAQRSTGPSASYAGKVAARVKPNIVFTEDIAGNPTAEVEVRAAPNGIILSRRLDKSSGIKAWDEAVLKAIDKTEKLPVDTDGRVPTSLIITFRPKD